MRIPLGPVLLSVVLLLVATPAVAKVDCAPPPAAAGDAKAGTTPKGDPNCYPPPEFRGGAGLATASVADLRTN